MKRAVIRSTSSDGHRSLIVVDATRPHFSARDVIDAAMVGDIIGNEVDIRTVEVPDDAPPMPGPTEVANALEATRHVYDNAEGLTAEMLDALDSAIRSLEGRE